MYTIKKRTEIRVRKKRSTWQIQIHRTVFNADFDKINSLHICSSTPKIQMYYNENIYLTKLRLHPWLFASKGALYLDG